MESPSSELITGSASNEMLNKPVPKPFSIEALISDTGPKRDNSIYNQWSSPVAYNSFQHRVYRDTDSEGSLDFDLAQDLSTQSQKDGKFSNNTFFKVFL